MANRQVRRVGRPVFTRSQPAPARQWQKPPGKRRGWLKYVLCLGVLILFWRYFAINDVQVSGQRSIDKKTIELSVRKGIKKQLLGDNLVTLSSSRLQDSVIGEIPEIKLLKINRDWPRTLKIRVAERDPSLAWQSGGELYLLDLDGTAIRSITDSLGRLPVVTDTTNLPVKTGERVVPARFVRFTLDVHTGLTGLGQKIEQMTVTDTTSELSVKLKAGYVVRFDTTRGAGSEIAALQKVLGELAKEHKKPAEYIDLRVEGKAYYK